MLHLRKQILETILRWSTPSTSWEWKGFAPEERKLGPGAASIRSRLNHICNIVRCFAVEKNRNVGDTRNQTSALSVHLCIYFGEVFGRSLEYMYLWHGGASVLAQRPPVSCGQAPFLRFPKQQEGWVPQPSCAGALLVCNHVRSVIILAVQKKRQS